MELVVLVVLVILLIPSGLSLVLLGARGSPLVVGWNRFLDPFTATNTNTNTNTNTKNTNTNTNMIGCQRQPVGGGMEQVLGSIYCHQCC